MGRIKGFHPDSWFGKISILYFETTNLKTCSSKNKILFNRLRGFLFNLMTVFMCFTFEIPDFADLCLHYVIDLWLWLALFAFHLIFLITNFSSPSTWWFLNCLSVYITDIDATGLDAEDNDIPANHRSLNLQCKQCNAAPTPKRKECPSLRR